MTFSIAKVELNGIMELTGTIDFPSKKMVVIYGSNQQGKTNVINAIRYAFLKDVFARAGRAKNEYDERKLPSREELMFGASARVEVSFLCDSVEYLLVRRIESGGKRETSSLCRSDAPKEGIDVEPFLRNKLKVSLLDALFAPEIAQGFEQLYSGDIEEAVSKMFKDVSTLRTLASAFVVRLDRLRDAAEAERVRIENSFNDFGTNLAKTAPTLTNLPGWEQVRKFKPSEIFSKLDSFHNEVQRLAEKLKEQGLEGEIADKLTKSTQQTSIEKALGQLDAIGKKIGQLQDTKHDSKVLTIWVRSASSVKSPSSRLKPAPLLRDTKVQAAVEAAVQDFTTAKEKRRLAEELAKKEGISVESVPENQEANSKVIKLLTAEARIGREVVASVTKSGGKVYTVLPFKLLERDPSYADISRQPIPKGNMKEKRQYLDSLKARQKRLEAIQDLQEESDTRFANFVESDFKKLNRLTDGLEKRIDDLKQEIDGWVDVLTTGVSSFTGKNIRKPVMANVRGATKFAKAVESEVSKAASEHLHDVNRILNDLGITIAAFSQSELNQALARIRAQRGGLPQIESAEDALSTKKEEWRGVDQQYADYTVVPGIVGETKATLELILSKCFDEAALRKEIADTYNEIINILRERRLIQATAEIGPQELKSVVTYKGKRISHPAGSEKSFFSLAILTALAHYFQTPVLIDEVANNLDAKNLRAFFELVREFRDKYYVQYVLSIKQTNDFELGGWVSELGNEIALHEIKDKNITQIEIQ